MDKLKSIFSGLLVAKASGTHTTIFILYFCYGNLVFGFFIYAFNFRNSDIYCWLFYYFNSFL